MRNALASAWVWVFEAVVALNAKLLLRSAVPDRFRSRESATEPVSRDCSLLAALACKGRQSSTFILLIHPFCEQSIFKLLVLLHLLTFNSALPFARDSHKPAIILFFTGPRLGLGLTTRCGPCFTRLPARLPAPGQTRQAHCYPSKRHPQPHSHPRGPWPYIFHVTMSDSEDDRPLVAGTSRAFPLICLRSDAALSALF